MRIKAFIIKLSFIIITLLVLSFLGLVTYQIQYSKTSSADYIDKLKIVENINVNKAIFIGGSSTGFGISAELFEDTTGIRAVNLSSSADISFDLFIRSIEPYLKSGDILFIAPEYGYYSSVFDSIKSESSIDFFLFLNPSVLTNIKLSNIIKTIPNMVKVGWACWGNSTQEVIKSMLFGNSFGIYNRGSINNNGDTISHKRLFSKGNIPLSVVDYTDNGFINDLNTTCLKLSNKGVSIILLYPPFAESSYINSEGDINKIATVLHERKNLSFTVLHSPQDTRYSDDCFYDTPYHLTYEMAQVHTQMILSKLYETKLIH